MPYAIMQGVMAYLGHAIGHLQKQSENGEMEYYGVYYDAIGLLSVAMWDVRHDYLETAG